MSASTLEIFEKIIIEVPRATESRTYNQVCQAYQVYKAMVSTTENILIVFRLLSSVTALVTKSKEVLSCDHINIYTIF